MSNGGYPTLQDPYSREVRLAQPILIMSALWLCIEELWSWDAAEFRVF